MNDDVYRSALICWVVGLTMKRKTLELITGTKPCGEIINGRQTLILSIADAFDIENLYQ